MTTRLRFACKNPEKYVGDPNRIFLRSRWETVYASALDASPLVRRWQSEPKTLNINYLSPIDKQVHAYWPDFLVQYTDGSIDIVEIKPLKQALAEQAKNTYDKISLIKNVAKWTAADHFAKVIGARFIVVTEKNLFKPRSTGQPRRPAAPAKPRGTRR